MVFNCRASIQNETDLSFFGANTIGVAQSDCAGSMMFIHSFLSIFAYSNLRAFGPRRYNGELVGQTFVDVSSIRCLAILIRPKSLYHICSNACSLSMICFWGLLYDSLTLTVYPLYVWRASVSTVLTFLWGRFGILLILFPYDVRQQLGQLGFRSFVVYFLSTARQKFLFLTFSGVKPAFFHSTVSLLSYAFFLFWEKCCLGEVDYHFQ